jgi:SAM-dependent methyltransferase|eukprot:COSAG01_NODE_13070_length_1641_cov_1.622568_2_plen_159_part_00
MLPTPSELRALVLPARARQQQGQPGQPGLRTLVLGCGNSNLSVDLAKAGYGHITSVDISEVCVAQLRQRHSACAAAAAAGAGGGGDDDHGTEQQEQGRLPLSFEVHGACTRGPEGEGLPLCADTPAGQQFMAVGPVINATRHAWRQRPRSPPCATLHR